MKVMAAFSALTTLLPLLAAVLVAMVLLAQGRARAAEPVLVGLDLEQLDITSTSDEAILFGAQEAVREINARGGVLGGRPLKLVARDNRSVPQRGVANIREFARMPELVAFITGKFSPVAIEEVRLLPELKLIMLDPWAAADGIVDNGQDPNWAFRLSMNDTMAVAAVLHHARARGYTRLGAMLPTITWGRSNHDALRRELPRVKKLGLAGVEWYTQAGEPVLIDRLHALRQAGAQAIFLVANEREGAQLLREMEQLPAAERLPIISHWGVTGGDFPALTGTALHVQDFVVAQTYSFGMARHGRARALAKAAMRHFGVEHVEKIPSPVGIAHAYDLVHLLALAVEAAGSTDRQAVRSALERLPSYSGVVRHFAHPFTATRHEALGPGDVFFARYRPDGRLERLRKP